VIRMDLELQQEEGKDCWEMRFHIEQFGGEQSGSEGSQPLRQHSRVARRFDTYFYSLPENYPENHGRQTHDEQSE
jgi:hypothetical protein